MTMTVSRLHKMLGALIEAGHGRKQVLVDRSTFSDPRDNDGLLMLPPWDVQGPRWIPTADDDGSTKWNKDGTESGQQCVLIVGDCAEPEGKAGVAAVPPRIGPEGWKRLAESQQALGEAEKRIEEISDRYGLGGASGVALPRAPLTVGQIKEAVRAEGLVPGMLDARIARAVERAHGIGVKGPDHG